jgi:predicted ATPase
VSDVPAELNELCMKTAPSQSRASAVRASDSSSPWRREDRAVKNTSDAAPVVASRQRVPFVGRDRQTQALIDAFNATRQGQTVTCYVHGESGVGKTALVRNFLDDLSESDTETVILEGRCYERESGALQSAGLA